MKTILVGGDKPLSAAQRARFRLAVEAQKRTRSVHAQAGGTPAVRTDRHLRSKGAWSDQIGVRYFSRKQLREAALRKGWRADI